MTEKQIKQFDALFEIIKKLFSCGYTGKIVLNFNHGGITRVEEYKTFEI